MLKLTFALEERLYVKADSSLQEHIPEDLHREAVLLTILEVLLIHQDHLDYRLPSNWLDELYKLHHHFCQGVYLLYLLIGYKRSLPRFNLLYDQGHGILELTFAIFQQ